MEDARGGIIANGMGLGKTLTMLAAIFASLTRAKESVVMNSVGLAGSQVGIVPSKGTSVVVPSAFELHTTYDYLLTTKRSSTYGLLAGRD